MPTYTIVNEEIVNEILEELTMIAKSLVYSPSKESFKYFIMELFEYCQIYVGYHNRGNGGTLESIKFTLTDLKKEFSDGKGQERYVFLKAFKDTADELRHELNRGDTPVITVVEKFKNDTILLEKLLNIVFEDGCYVKDFVLSPLFYDVFNESFNRDKCKEDCTRYCLSLLKVHGSSSKYTVGEVVEIVSKELNISKGFVRNVICEILSSHYVVPEK